jgi:predicted alpha-1,6-mannanase (GH76 family)
MSWRSKQKHLLAVPTLLFLLLPPLTIAGAPPQSAAVDDSADSVQQVQLAIDRLQQWYDPQTGLWKTGGWWNAANSITAIVDFSRATHSSQYLPIIAGTYAAQAHTRFLKNKFYDDEGWWALAWIDAFDLTSDQTYLRSASVIFNDMKSGWDDTCGGGIWWTKERTYKNAIANELFLSVAAHLANRVTDSTLNAEYASWAKREWRWLQHSGMIEPDLLISDGLDSHCRDNHATKWTYNQGVVLGGLAELSNLPGQSGELREARRIADAALKKLADSHRVLHEPCEPKCGGDGTQFKGIFIRNLAQLNERSRSARYVPFIVANAESLLKDSQNTDHSFGVVWSGPPDVATSVSQTSAIDALNAALRVSRGSNRN